MFTFRITRILPVLIFISFLAACQKDRSLEKIVSLDELIDAALSLELNPYDETPLAASLQFESLVPVMVSFSIGGSDPLQHTFPTFETQHNLPILGLYPGIDNAVTITLEDQAGNKASTTLHVQTEELPEYFPVIETNVSTPLRQDGWTLLGFSVGLGTSFKSVPTIIDASGNIRWFMELDEFSDISFPIKQKSNGHLLISNLEHVYEYDMLGTVVNDISFPGYTQHHETREMPNGNLLIAVDKEGLSTVEDHVIEVTPSGTIVTEWDLRSILDIDRFDLVEDEVDWFHNNALWYSEVDDCLLVSGRGQGVIKVTRSNELVWILAPHKGWGLAENGNNTQDFLLTAVRADGTAYPDEVQLGNEAADDFDWCWGQHAIMTLENGNLFLFDNGFNRQFIPGAPSYSRAAEYRINEADKTVEEIWQYGKERGVECWAPIISDVDVLMNTNRLITCGIVFGAEPYAKLIEVSYPDKSIVYEITLSFKNLLADGGLAWGGLDLNYRSERLDIYPKN